MKEDFLKMYKKNNRKNNSPISSMLTLLLIIAGVLSFVIILSFYFFNFNGPISNKVEDWNLFATIFTAASSTLMSLTTLGILILSITQFKKQSEQIDEMSMMNKFDMYTKHTIAFYNHIDFINTKIERYYSISNKNSLYKDIFQENSNNYITLNPNYDFLDDIKNKIKSISYSLENEISDSVINDIIVLQTKLYLFQNAEQHSLVVLNKTNEHLTSPLEISKKIELINFVIESITNFTGKNNLPRTKIDSKKATYNMELYIIKSLESNNCDNIGNNRGLDLSILKLLNSLKTWISNNANTCDNNYIELLHSCSGERFKHTVENFSNDTCSITSVFKNYEQNLPNELHDLFTNAYNEKTY